MKAGLLALGLFLTACAILIWLYFRLNETASWWHVIDFGAGMLSFLLILIAIGVAISATGNKNDPWK